MYKKVVFFNYYHNGDIHLSRGLLRQVMQKVHQINPDVQFYYSHRNTPDLLADINITFDPFGLSIIRNDHAGIVGVGDTVYINTWYGQQQFRYMNAYGISFDTLYLAFNEACKQIWGFSLEEISQDPGVFFPWIDYSKYQINNVNAWLSSNSSKKIFISNGDTLSGQAHNFDLTSLALDVARNHTDKTFILSNKTGATVPSNVLWSSDIIGRGGCDLNENGFITEHCDVIIGRSSGTFTFAQTQNNYLKRQCKILNFSNLVPKKPGYYWLDTLLQDKMTYTANIITTYDSDMNNIRGLIETHTQ
jgi:hypothetical protein